TYIIQSGSYSADAISRKADAFIETLGEVITKMTDDDFAQVKNAIKEKLLEKPKSIAEKANIFYDLTFEKAKDFNRLEENLAALESVSKEDVLALYKKAMSKETRKVVELRLYAAEHKVSEEVAEGVEVVTIPKAFREKREYRKK
ncbi:MAG: hypothetical protein HQL32_15690, partial [Planctomycetes bacterium]|nr:hypothetical protein [Planctomycetota bacterium]